MEDQVVVVLVTAPSPESGRQIARRLVEQKLAACVNLIAPVRSIYTWQGAVQEDEETLLVIKTRAELVERQLIPAIRAEHPYQVPEILALPVAAGSADYLRWIAEVT